MKRPSTLRVYRRYSPIKITLVSLGVLAALVIVIFISIVFGFRKYIVYSGDELYLDVPWLEEEAQAPSDATPEPPTVVID